VKRVFLDFLVSTDRVRSEQIGSVAAAGTDAWEPIGRLALLHGIISPDDIDKILSLQKKGNEYFGQIAIQLGLITESQLALILTGQAVRACLELIETLVIGEVLDLPVGLSALTEFITQENFLERITSQCHGRM
jgi:hypothetical protein